MKVKVTREFISARGIIPVGRIIEISAVLLKKLRGNVEQIDPAGDLWKWFVLEADKVYRTSPKAADSWAYHKKHRTAAHELCKAGHIAEARRELNNALTALQGAALTQTTYFKSKINCTN